VNGILLAAWKVNFFNRAASGPLQRFTGKKLGRNACGQSPLQGRTNCRFHPACGITKIQNARRLRAAGLDAVGRLMQFGIFEAVRPRTRDSDSD